MILTGLYAYLVFQYIRPQDFHPLFYNLPVIEFLVPVIVIAAIIKAIQQRQPISLPQNYFLIFYVGAVFLSLATFSMDAATAQFTEYLKKLTIFFMFLIAVDSRTKLKYVLYFIIILSAILAVEAMYHQAYSIGWAGQTFKDDRVRWVGDWDGANVFALIFVISLGLSLEFLGNLRGFYTFVFNLIATGLLLTALYLTNSRGGVLAVLSLFVFYIAERARKSKKSVILGVLLLLVLYGNMPSRMNELSSGESSAHERTWLWEQGLGMMRENPVLGVGKGQFRLHSTSGMVAHSNYVTNMAEVGFLGYFLWMGALYFSVKSVYSAKRYLAKLAEGAQLASMANAMLLALIGFHVATFFVTMELDILFILWGLSAATINIARMEYNMPSPRLSVIDIIIILSMIFATMGVIYLAAEGKIL